MNPARGLGVKKSLYLSPDVVQEIEDEARRLERSLSWIAQRAFCLARGRLRAMPSADEHARGERGH